MIHLLLGTPKLSLCVHCLIDATGFSSEELWLRNRTATAFNVTFEEAAKANQWNISHCMNILPTCLTGLSKLGFHEFFFLQIQNVDLQSFQETPATSGNTFEHYLWN
jgi:hypothetical protein